RPFIGEMNYCLTEERILQFDEQQLLDITKHEIGHVLGFHPAMFNTLPDLDHDFQLSSNNERPVQDITLRWKSTKGTFNIQKTIIRLPNMLKEARRHFGCAELQGIELVNDHFSHRIMGNDLMTPSKLVIQHASRISLAYFKDTGMYDVDYSMAEDFTWGKGLGCDFVMKSCYEFIRNRQSRGEDIQPFCNERNKIKCLNSEHAFGRCSIYKYGTELPLENQYIDSTFNVRPNETQYYGGSSLFDYCPIIEKYWIDENRTSSCTSKISLKPDLTTNRLLEDVGRKSTCFEHTPMEYHSQSLITPDSRTASCHKFKCLESVLQIIIGETEYRCPIQGGIIRIGVKLETATVYTNITCPRCQTICKKCTSEK
ncbi:hypothetical protein MN116_000081, partial [Schistosoma mekongi]